MFWAVVGWAQLFKMNNELHHYKYHKGLEMMLA
jgi:hypothetical protein